MNLSRIKLFLKAGDIVPVSNYRPIAILPTAAKLFEHIIHEKLYNDVKFSIYSQQHEFMANMYT